MRHATAALLALATLAATSSTYAQACDQLVLEASLHIPAGAGQGAIAFDGGHVWISQQSLALRYSRIQGSWTNDAFLNFPAGASPRLLAAGGGRVMVAQAIFEQSNGFQQIGSAAVGSLDCEYSDGARLGNQFVVYGTDCLNFRIKGVAQDGYGIQVWPPYTPGLPAPRYAVRARGPYGYVATKSHYGGANLPLQIYRWTVRGTAAAAQLSGSGGIPDGPLLGLLVDYTPLADGGVIAALRKATNGNLVDVIAHFDGMSWITAPVPEYAFEYRVADASNRMFLAADNRIHEVRRTQEGTIEFTFHSTMPGRIEGFVGDGDFLAARINDPLVPSQTRLNIYRVRGWTDCNLNAMDDCAEIAAGAASDVNANGIPDSCECIADLFPDGFVNGADLGILLNQWGMGEGAASDIDRSGMVDGADLSLLLNTWGACP